MVRTLLVEHPQRPMRLATIAEHRRPDDVRVDRAGCVPAANGGTNLQAAGGRSLCVPIAAGLTVGAREEQQRFAVSVGAAEPGRFFEEAHLLDGGHSSRRVASEACDGRIIRETAAKYRRRDRSPAAQVAQHLVHQHARLRGLARLREIARAPAGQLGSCILIAGGALRRQEVGDQRAMAIEVAELAKAAGDTEEEIQPHQRVTAEPLVHHADRPLQLLLQIRRRSPDGEIGGQVVRQLGVRLRDPRRTPRQLGLGVGAKGFADRNVALRPGLVRLPEGDAGAGHDRGRGHARCRRRQAVARDELPEPVGAAVGAREHRPSAQPVFEIVTEGSDRRIAFVWHFFQRLEHDGVQIAAQGAPQRNVPDQSARRLHGGLKNGLFHRPARVTAELVGTRTGHAARTTRRRGNTRRMRC